MKEEGGADIKKEVESAESEKEIDTKETTNTETSDETNVEQKQGEANTEEEKPVEKTDADKEEGKPDAVAIEMTENVEQVAVPVEEEGKTESAEGGEGEVKPESTEGGEGVTPVPVETTVITETETGMDHSKYEELDDELPWAMYRSLDTPPQRPPVEEDDEWPASDDEGDYGNILRLFLFCFSLHALLIWCVLLWCTCMCGGTVV